MKIDHWRDGMRVNTSVLSYIVCDEDRSLEKWNELLFVIRVNTSVLSYIVCDEDRSLERWNEGKHICIILHCM